MGDRTHRSDEERAQRRSQPERPGRAPDSPTAERLFEFQRTAGNAAVRGMLSPGGGSQGLRIQRHPVGAGLTIDPGTALAEQEAAEAQAIPGGPAPAPTRAEPEPEAPAAEGGFFSAIGSFFSGIGSAVRSMFGGAETKAPAPAAPAYLDIAKAEEVLEKVYGTKKDITPGKIEFLDTTEDAWAKYDELCIAGGVTNPRTSAAWAAGDAKISYPLGLNGFAWKGTSYINKASAVATTTPHEMLHNNTAAGFRAAVGETLNEGITQWLTVKALKASGIEPPKALPYSDEVEVAQALIDLVGETAVIDAYFKGGASTAALIKAVDDALGAGSFATAKEKGDKKEWSEAKRALRRPLGDFPLPAPGGDMVA